MVVQLHQPSPLVHSHLQVNIVDPSGNRIWNSRGSMRIPVIRHPKKIPLSQCLQMAERQDGVHRAMMYSWWRWRKNILTTWCIINSNRSTVYDTPGSQDRSSNSSSSIHLA
jgi:hypothetical protein